MKKVLLSTFVTLAIIVVILVYKKQFWSSGLAGIDAFQTICVKQAEAKNVNSEICKSISKEFFRTSEAVEDLVPEVLGAPALPTDAKTKIVVVLDPRYVAQLAYCYFQFRGWFDPKSFSPEALSLATSGFAILKEEMEGYVEWQNSDLGKDCARKVLKYAGSEMHDLTSIFHDHESLIAINPVAAIQTGRGVEDVKNEALLTINHERIHVLQSLCKKLNQIAVKMWSSLPNAKKEKMKKKFPAYDWSNPVVAARENLAFNYETKPLEVLRLVNCKY